MAKNKIDAVYELRAAAEEHGRAEKMIETDRSPENIDRLVDAKEVMEIKTIEAIEACHECGEYHCSDESHKKGADVINVNFDQHENDAAGS